jgi:arylsulfatase A-like enzyme
LTNRVDATPNRNALYWHFPGYLGADGGTWRTSPGGAIREGDWKLIEFFEDGRIELYNLRKDIGERINLAATDPEKAKELHDKLAVWREYVGAPMPIVNAAIRPATDQAGTKKRRDRAQGD